MKGFCMLSMCTSSSHYILVSINMNALFSWLLHLALSCSYIILSLFLDLGEMHVVYVMGFLLYITCELTPLFYESIQHAIKICSFLSLIINSWCITCLSDVKYALIIVLIVHPLIFCIRMIYQSIVTITWTWLVEAFI